MHGNEAVSVVPSLTEVMPHSSHPLRVLLDARKMHDGGIGVYIQNLVEALADRPDVQLTLLGPRQDTISTAWAKRVSVIPNTTRSYSLGELFSLNRIAAASVFDVWHSPHYTLPLGLKIPAIVTIHDLIHVTHPEHFYYPWIARAWIGFGVRRAERVITVSRSSAEELMQNFPQVTPKLRTIANAIKPTLTEQFTHAIADVQSPSQRIDFFALLSMAKPHKGLLDLLSAFEEASNAYAKTDSKRSLHLTIAGSPLIADTMPRRFKDQKNITYIGRVSEQELAKRYCQCAALIIPSLTEGFCLPALEARAVRLPVIARPVPAIRELLGTNDFIAQDFSRKALTRAILEFLKGFHQAQPVLDHEILERYNLQHLGDATVAAYREACAARTQYQEVQ